MCSQQCPCVWENRKSHFMRVLWAPPSTQLYVSGESVHYIQENNVLYFIFSEQILQGSNQCTLNVNMWFTCRMNVWLYYIYSDFLHLLVPTSMLPSLTHTGVLMRSVCRPLKAGTVSLRSYAVFHTVWLNHGLSGFGGRCCNINTSINILQILLVSDEDQNTSTYWHISSECEGSSI